MENQIQTVLKAMDDIKIAFDRFTVTVDEDMFSLELMRAYEGLMEELGKTLARVKIKS